MLYDEVRYHGRLTQSPVRLDSLDLALNGRSFVLESEESHDSVQRRSYRLGNGRLEVKVFTDSSGPQVYVAGIRAEHWRTLGPPTVLRLLNSISDSLDIIVGRMLGEDPTLTYVRSAELDGGIDSLSWYQYYRQSASPWKKDFLEAGPFDQVIETDRGVAFTLAADPFAGPVSVRRAAAYLGLRLRPLMARNPITGELVEIPWD